MAISPGMPADGTDTNRPIALVNFAAFVLAQRVGGLSVRVLKERYADSSQVGVVVFQRCGGQLWDPSACIAGVV